LGGARPRSSVARPRAEFAVPARVREWIAEEASAGRLFPWFAVAFGLGIVFYFTADHEPMWWAASTLAAGCALLVVLLRRHAVAFVVALALSGMSAGFAAATIKKPDQSSRSGISGLGRNHYGFCRASRGEPAY